MCNQIQIAVGKKQRKFWSKLKSIALKRLEMTKRKLRLAKKWSHMSFFDLWDSSEFSGLAILCIQKDYLIAGFFELVCRSERLSSFWEDSLRFFYLRFINVSFIQLKLSKILWDLLEFFKRSNLRNPLMFPGFVEVIILKSFEGSSNPEILRDSQRFSITLAKIIR